jgi:hypothetical protein
MIESIPLDARLYGDRAEVFATAQSADLGPTPERS